MDSASEHNVEVGGSLALRVSTVSLLSILLLSSVSLLCIPPIHDSVNIGGWLVLEPFISPALFQRYPDAVDEWTISTLMAADAANGGLSQLENHYDTFIVRQTILPCLRSLISIHHVSYVRLPSRPNKILQRSQALG